MTNGVATDTHNSSNQPHDAVTSLSGSGEPVTPPSVGESLGDVDSGVITQPPVKTNGVEDCDVHPDTPAHSQTDLMWQQLELAMTQSQDSVRAHLHEFGIGEGDEDSESEEGQMWRIVQGDSPYIIQLV